MRGRRIEVEKSAQGESAGAVRATAACGAERRLGVIDVGGTRGFDARQAPIDFGASGRRVRAAKPMQTRPRINMESVPGSGAEA